MAHPGRSALTRVKKRCTVHPPNWSKLDGEFEDHSTDHQPCWAANVNVAGRRAQKGKRNVKKTEAFEHVRRTHVSVNVDADASRRLLCIQV